MTTRALDEQRQAVAERDMAIVALARIDKLPPATIGKRFGLSPSYVSTILSRARMAGADIPRFDSNLAAGASTATRDAAIVAAAMAREPTAAIARRFCISKNRVANILCLARKAGKPVPRLRVQGVRRAAVDASVAVTPVTLERLQSPADRRRTTPVDLARLIVETVAREGLVDAVLDDLHG